MIVLEISDTLNLMQKILVNNSFDDYLVEEVKVVTFGKMEISGKRNKSWFDNDEREIKDDLPDLLQWMEVKPFVFNYIKGKKVPTFFQISLKLSEKQKVQRMGENTGGIDFLLHFRFDKGKLVVVSGCDFKVFSLDKSAWQMWDEEIKRILRELKIAFVC